MQARGVAPAVYFDDASRARHASDLVQTLIEHDLADEFRMMIDPVVVGGGKADLPRCRSPQAAALISNQVTTTGAIIATYARPVGDSVRKTSASSAARPTRARNLQAPQSPPYPVAAPRCAIRGKRKGSDFAGHVQSRLAD